MDFAQKHRESLEADHHQIGVDFEEFEPLPMKPLACAICLLLSGIVLIIIGFVEEVVDIDPTRGIAFWVLGALTFIPGSYFSYQFYKAYRAKTPRARSQILRNIPDM